MLRTSAIAVLLLCGLLFAGCVAGGSGTGHTDADPRPEERGEAEPFRVGDAPVIVFEPFPATTVEWVDELPSDAGEHDGRGYLQFQTSAVYSEPLVVRTFEAPDHCAVTVQPVRLRLEFSKILLLRSQPADQVPETRWRQAVLSAELQVLWERGAWRDRLTGAEWAAGPLREQLAEDACEERPRSVEEAVRMDVDAALAEFHAAYAAAVSTFREHMDVLWEEMQNAERASQGLWDDEDAADDE